MLLAAVHEYLAGTLETCRRTLRISVHRGGRWTGSERRTGSPTRLRNYRYHCRGIFCVTWNTKGSAGRSHHAGDTSPPIVAAGGRQTRPQKNYAVGLEMSCPGGAYYWPKIPSSRMIAGAMLSKCELVHNRAHSFCAAASKSHRILRQLARCDWISPLNGNFINDRSTPGGAPLDTRGRGSIA
jgi:hypothetical protein